MPQRRMFIAKAFPLLVFLPLSWQLIINNPKLCKPLSDSSNWPSTQAWQALNLSVSGNLLHGHPPAIVCDTSRPDTFDTAACVRVGESWLNSSFHSDDPVSVTYPNWQDDACLPSAIYNGSSRCNLQPFPSYVLNASTADHVMEAVKFAATTGVRLIVKGGAHDLLGRYAIKSRELTITT